MQAKHRITIKRPAVVALLAAAALALSTAPALGAPPANDSFSAATPLNGSKGQAKGTNREATKEPGEPDHAGLSGGASVWWAWTAPRSGRLFLNTRGSTLDTLLAVYTGSAVDALTPVASNDDVPGGRLKVSELSFPAVAGTTYYIAVDGFTGRGSTIVLTWAQGPENDDFANALALQGARGQAVGANDLATREPGERGRGHSIWYRWTAPANMTVRFDTRGSRNEYGSLYASLTVYRGEGIGGLRVVARNSGLYGGNFSEPNGILSFRAERDAIYAIAVDSYGEGRVVLNWAEGAVLIGGPRRDVLVGTAGADILVGGGGNDVIRAAGGNDVLDGGSGNDRLEGAAGADFLVDKYGEDVLRGGAGNDDVNARDSRRGDVVDGGGGRDDCLADRTDQKRGCP
jgi:Ca2+-binding RTX toxin-like protein